MEHFGSPGIAPANLIVVASDAEIGQLFAQGIRQISVDGGDLAQSLGSAGTVVASGEPCTMCAVDAIRVVATTPSGEDREFVAFSTVRFGHWRGELDFVTSSGFDQGLELCPRSHPGDGALDRLQVQPGLKWRERLAIRKRMRSGTHLPHPMLQVSRGASFDFVGKRSLILDSVPRGVYGRVHCSVMTHAMVIVTPRHG